MLDRVAALSGESTTNVDLFGGDDLRSLIEIARRPTLWSHRQVKKLGSRIAALALDESPTMLHR
jgi:hypothetical protein